MSKPLRTSVRTLPVNCDTWNIREDDFPRNTSPCEKLCFLLHYPVLAPSGHNTQPWLFEVRGDRAYLYADSRRALPVVDPDAREMTIACGAALTNLQVAIQHFGYEPQVEYCPRLNSLGLLARVRLGAAREATEDEHMHFAAITRRHTSRTPFDKRSVPAPLLLSLQAAAAQEGAWLHIIEGGRARMAVADLIARADRLQWSNRSFRRELADWMRPNRSEQRDGIPGYGLGFGDLGSRIGPVVMRAFDLGNGQAARHRGLATKSPVLAVLGTSSDTPTAWLTAGQALQAVLLKATAGGLSASFLNQPIELGSLRAQLRDLIGRGGVPQLLLRIGYGRQARPTPRRRLGEVLLG